MVVDWAYEAVFSQGLSCSQMVARTGVMTKASPFICLVVDAGLSSGTSVGSVGWSLHGPSLRDLDFLKVWWTARASKHSKEGQVRAVSSCF